MHSRLLSALGMTTLLSSLSLVACGDSSSGPGKTPAPPTPTGRTIPAQLVRAQTCDELETLLKDDAKKKLEDGIDEQIKAIREYGGYWGYGYGRDGEGFPVGAPVGGNAGGNAGGQAGVGGAGGAGGAGGGPLSPTPTPPTNGDSDGEGAGDGSAGGPTYSDTNTQVKDVDEADFVETDGTNVYVLHGKKFLTLGAQANAPSVAQAVDIDGTPREMFVARDGEQGPRRAVIYSDVNGSAVYAAAGVTPKTNYYDYGYGNGGGFVGDVAVGGVRNPGGAIGAVDVADVAVPPDAYAPLTKVTVLDLENGPSKISEVYFEGSYSTARRVGSVVRTVLNGGQHGPELNQFPLFDAQHLPPAPQDVDGWVAAFELVRAEGLAAIDASAVTDWLPYVFVKTGESVEATNLACDSYHVPGAGSTQYGLTQIQSFDLRAPTQVKGTAIVGHADVVYSNTDSLYVATHGWNPTPPPPVFPQPFPNPFPGEPFPGGTGGFGGVGGSAGVAGSSESGSAGTGTGGGTGGTGTGGVAGGTGGTGTGGVAGGTGGTGTGGGTGGTGTGGGTSGTGTGGVGGGTSGTGTGGVGGGTSGTGTGGAGGGTSGTGTGGVGGGTSGTGTGGVGGGTSGVGGATGGSAGGPVDPPEPTTLNVTHLHKFDLRSDPTSPLYVATGTVPGSVKNQFSLDESDGYLRIATNENRTTGEDFWSIDRFNHLYVLDETSDGLLEVVGDAGELAKDETITAVRFVGNRGYVVTFLQKDPLFVFDLSDPTAPTLLGQADIPGFSEYMHPLDETHLLTIGQDGDANGANGRLALQIFDVSNPLVPVQAHKFAFSGDNYGYSQAQYDHKAFTYFADKKLLAFPYFSNSFGLQGEYQTKSTLELFRVDLDQGFARLDAVDHSPLFSNQTPCGYSSYGPEVRRGLFIGDYVYSLSYAGLLVNDVNNLAAGPVGQLDLLPYLDAPTFPGGPVYDGSGGSCYPTDGGGDGGGGSSGGGGVTPVPTPVPTPKAEPTPVDPAGDRSDLALAD